MPDESAQVEVWHYLNPRAAKWPAADFIIGNPPFIGNKRMRDQLSDAYFEALRRAHRKVRGDADLVFYWWRRASLLVAQGRSARAGLITTNTLGQASGAAIIEEALGRLNPVSIVFAVRDHPWRDGQTDAAVRVSMTTVEAGTKPGRLLCIDPMSGELIDEAIGRIGADIGLGADVRTVRPLKSNAHMSFMGVKLAGDGFRITGVDRNNFLLQGVPASMMPMLLAGSDITGRSRDRYVIDAFGRSEAQIRDGYPSLYDHLYNHVRPGRVHLKRKAYRDQWWIFAEPRPKMRDALAQLSRFIVTSEVSKHRTFTFVERETFVADGSVIVIAHEDAVMLAVVSSRFHRVWTLRLAGTLEDRPRYQNSVAFDPFPFPVINNGKLTESLSIYAERLDALRKQVLAQHSDLTLTKLYNSLEALRSAEATGSVLPAKDRDIAERGCVSLMRHYHDAIDAAVAEAYGWPADLSDEDILERLVALNKERAAEEARGKVRWLRPDYQAPAYVAPKQEPMPLAAVERPSAQVIEWPGALPDQVVAVAGVVARAGRPVAGSDVARAFRAKRAGTVLPVLDALAGMGRVRKLEDGRYAA